MIARISTVAALVTGALALLASPALASLGSEVARGQQVAAQVQAGKVSCSKLSDSDFEHLGEYVMDRMIGSRSTHQAMNDRMESMMGTDTADRMHEALGRRFADCPGGGAGGMMGGAMMGGGGMMGAGNWSWMRNGSWRHMTQAQWRNAANSIMGGGWMMSGNGNGGWHTAAVVGAVLIALLLGGLIVYAIVRIEQRRHPGGAAAT